MKVVIGVTEAHTFKIIIHTVLLRKVRLQYMRVIQARE